MSSTTRRAPGRERLVERPRDPRQRPAALVAIEPRVAARDVTGRDAALPGPRDTHHDHDVALAGSGLSRTPAPAHALPRRAWPQDAAEPERPLDRMHRFVVERQRRGTRGRARGLRTPRPRDRDDRRRQSEQPRERDLGRRRGQPASDLGQDARVTRRPAPRAGRRRAASARSPRSPRSIAARHDAAPRRRGHRATLSGTSTAAIGASASASSNWRRLTLDESHPRDEAVVDEPRERPHRGPPRHARVGRVQQPEVDRAPAQRREARLAVGADRLRPTVRDPAAVRSRHAALGHHPHAPGRPAGAQRRREQPLVRARRRAVRVRGIEDRHARRDRRGDRVPRRASSSAGSRMQPRPMRASDASSQAVPVRTRRVRG